jgi:hypothetical protein
MQCSNESNGKLFEVDTRNTSELLHIHCTKKQVPIDQKNYHCSMNAWPIDVHLYDNMITILNLKVTAPFDQVKEVIVYIDG